jgi:hypothetical protein
VPTHATIPQDGRPNRRGVTHSTKTIVHGLKLKRAIETTCSLSHEYQKHKRCTLRTHIGTAVCWLLLKNKQVTMIIERRKIQANNAFENLGLATKPLSWAASIMWSLN